METKRCKGPCGLEKPLTEFYDSRQGEAVYKFAKCKECCSKRTKALRSASGKDKVRWAQYAHNTNTRRRYGLEPEQYQLMVEEQSGVCAICKQPNPDGKRLSVDHDHETRRVRGLLCSGCNNGLGRFKDDSTLLRHAAAYLERPYVPPTVPVLPQVPLPKAATTPKTHFCVVDGCGRPTFYRLYCQMHYFRLWRTGSLDLRRRVTSVS